MGHEEMVVEPLAADTQAPMELLYDADPSAEAVADYLIRGACYVGKLGGRVAGVNIGDGAIN